MVDVRALVHEVAEKHDAMCKYRNEVKRQQEQLKHQDRQMYFKDNIIRDLRRESKQVDAENSDANKEQSRLCPVFRVIF